MGIILLATLLSTAPLARSRADAATNTAKLERTSGVRNLQPGLFGQPAPASVASAISTPIYDQEECDSWTSTLVANDENDSDGVSGSEYHAFLSGIEDPPYISAYFEAYEDFDHLPWVFRVVHKTLACHCEKLGFGKECCEGDDAEILLQGLESTARNRLEEDYKDSFCQQIAYVLSQSIPSPAPTDGPTFSPTKSPSAGPSTSPSMFPSMVPSVAPTGGPTDGPTAGPTKLPSAGPTAVPSMGPSTAPTGSPSSGPAESPSAGPTASPSTGPTGGPTDGPTPGPTKSPSAGPTASPSTGPTAAPITILPVAVIAARNEEQGDGPGIGLIIRVALACLGLLVAILSFVAYRRRANEQMKPRNFSGGDDLEAPPMAIEEENDDSLVPPVEEDDNDSSVLSVWSGGEEQDAAEELYEDHKDPGATAGSALAAIGVASTVAARFGANNSDHSYSS